MLAGCNHQQPNLQIALCDRATDPILSGESGESVNSFLDSFVHSFIFLTSGSNWESFVLQAYRVDKMSHFLFLPLSMIVS